MTDFHVSEISNILHGESWEYLHALNTNQSFDIFHNRLIEILDLVSQDIMVRISAKHKIKDPWGLLFCVNLLKKMSTLYKKSVRIDDSSCEVRKYKDDKNMYNKIKRRSNITYY